MACNFTEFVKTEEKIKPSQTIYYLICIGLYFYLLIFFYYINTNNNQLNQQILKKLNNTETNLSNEYIKINNDNNINYLQQETLKKLTSIEHLLQQQLKIYYDIETNQMKVYENLPYIIIRNVNDISIELILFDKSQLIYQNKETFNKIDIYLKNKIISDTINEEFYNKIKDISKIQNIFNSHTTQFIIPLKKMLKIWVVIRKKAKETTHIEVSSGITFISPIMSYTYTVEVPRIYTNGIYNIDNTNEYIIWYGDIENKNNVHDKFKFQNILNNI